MADIIQGTYVDDQGGGNGTLSVTVNAGVYRYLLVGFSIWDTTAADRVLTVDYNGDSMIRLAGRTRGNNREIELWGLADPDVGTHNVTFTFDGTVTEWQVAAIPLINCSGVNVIDTSAGTGTTSRSVTLTTTEDRCQIYSFIILNPVATAIAVQGDETKLGNENDANQKFHIGKENSLVIPPGNENTGFTWSTSTGTALITVAMAPAPDGLGKIIYF